VNAVRWSCRTPTTFDGDVQLFALGAEDWETLPVSAGYVDSGRGFGIADLAATPEPQGSEPRAGGQLAYHVLEVMEAAVRCRAGFANSVPCPALCCRPAPLPSCLWTTPPPRSTI
jgi:hypothetical protein